MNHRWNMEVSSNGINRKRLIRTHLHELNGWNQLEAIDSDDPDKNKVGCIVKWNRLEAIDFDESSRRKIRSIRDKSSMGFESIVKWNQSLMVDWMKSSSDGIIVKMRLSDGTNQMSRFK